MAVGVARLGYSAGWISRLGADEMGAYVLGVMRGANVDVSNVQLVEGEQTGIFLRENRTSGSSSVFYYRSNSAFTTFSPDDLNEDYIASAQILHLTGITPGLSHTCRAAVERAIEIASTHGVRIVFDVNYRAKIWPREEARMCLEDLMRRADHVLAGREDLVKLVGIVDQERAAVLFEQPWIDDIRAQDRCRRYHFGGYRRNAPRPRRIDRECGRPVWRGRCLCCRVHCWAASGADESRCGSAGQQSSRLVDSAPGQYRIPAQLDRIGRHERRDLDDRPLRFAGHFY